MPKPASLTGLIRLAGKTYVIYPKPDGPGYWTRRFEGIDDVLDAATGKRTPTPAAPTSQPER